MFFTHKRDYTIYTVRLYQLYLMPWKKNINGNKNSDNEVDIGLEIKFKRTSNRYLVFFIIRVDIEYSLWRCIKLLIILYPALNNLIYYMNIIQSGCDNNISVPGTVILWSFLVQFLTLRTEIIWRTFTKLNKNTQKPWPSPLQN